MLSPGHGRCFYPWWAGAANWLLGLAMPSSQIRPFIHGKKRNVQSHWGSGQTLGDSQDRQAQKVPKAKIIGASTLSACLASVALSPGASPAELPPPWACAMPALILHTILCQHCLSSCPEEGNLGRRAMKEASLGWPLSCFGDEGGSWETQRVPTSPAPWVGVWAGRGGTLLAQVARVGAGLHMQHGLSLCNLCIWGHLEV